MSTIAIKKPEKGSIVRNDADGYTGKIVRILDYNLATSWMTDRSMLREFNDEMETRLGEQFRDMYFEAYIQLHEVKDDGRYQENQIVHVRWDEIQEMEIIAWESEQ